MPSVRLSLLELQILVALGDHKTLTQIAQELFLKHPSISRARCTLPNRKPGSLLRSTSAAGCI